MGDFDFDLSGFGDLSRFSLGGGEGAPGPAFSSDLNLGNVAQSPAFDTSSLPSLGGVSFDGGGGGGAPAGKSAASGLLGPIAGAAKEALPFAQLATAGMGIGAGIQGAR